jgi:hypothetical protein
LARKRASITPPSCVLPSTSNFLRLGKHEAEPMCAGRKPPRLLIPKYNSSRSSSLAREGGSVPVRCLGIHLDHVI